MEYDVKAKLELDTKAARAETKTLEKEVRNLQAQLGKGGKRKHQVLKDEAKASKVATQDVAQEAMAGMMALSGAMQGITAGFSLVQAGLSGMTQFIQSGVQYTTQLQTMQIGLASVFGAVENVSFKEAQEATKDIYDQLVQMAATSPVGPAELQEIFVGMYAPLRAAGVEMKGILETTKDASAALGALGIDLQQGSRDFALIAGGRAGADVKTFTKLVQARAFGAKITSAEQFNKLDATKRAAALQAALKKVGGESAAAFADSFVGLSSTLQGLYQEAQRALLEPIIGMAERQMKGFADFYLKIEKPFEQMLRLFGDLAQNTLDPVFSKGLKMAEDLLSSAVAFMGSVDSLGEGASILRGDSTSLASGALYGGAAIAGGAAGAGVGGVAGGALGSIVGLLTGTGPIATAIGSLAGAGVGGALGAGGGLLAAGAVDGLIEQAGALSEIFWELYDAFAPSIYYSLLDVWEMLAPLLKYLGTQVLVHVVVGVQGLLTVLAALGEIIVDLAKEFGIFSAEGNEFELSLKDLMQSLRDVTDGAREFANSLLRVYARFKLFGKGMFALASGDFAGAAKAAVQLHDDDINAPQLAYGSNLFGDNYKLPGGKQKFAKDKLAKQQVNVNIGSVSFKVQQSFKDSDPDRIVRTMFADLEEQAERVLASPFAGVFAR